MEPVICFARRRELSRLQACGSERGIFPHAAGRSRTGPRLFRRRGSALRRQDGYFDLLLMAKEIWRQKGCDRPDDSAQRRRAHHCRSVTAAFQFAPAGDSELWAPYHQDDQCAKRRGCHNLYGVARLKDGTSIEAARAEMAGIARQLELQYPVDNLGQGASVEPLSKVMVADVRPILLLLLGGAGLLLVIACANVSSLLLVRSESRKREIAVRGALGASRPRLIRQFVTEGFVLMAGGTILGVMAASGAMRILLHLSRKTCWRTCLILMVSGINLHVFLFALLVGMLAASLFSLAPIMRLPLSKGVREGLAEAVAAMREFCGAGSAPTW